MANYELVEGYGVTDDVVVLDQNGNEIPGLTLDSGSLSVSVADTTVLTATPSSDATTVDLESVALGTDDVVSLTGTVNGETLSGSYPVDVVAATPSAIGLVPGTPVAQTPPAPPA